MDPDPDKPTNPEFNFPSVQSPPPPDETFIPTLIPSASSLDLAISQQNQIFHDDSTLSDNFGQYSTENSIEEGFKILELYCKASGALLNLHKTKGLYIGSWKKKKPVFTKITWVENTTGLGAHFGYNINYEEIWLKKFAKFKKKLQSWKKRDLTLFGKIAVLKQLAIPKILFSASMLYTPEDIVKDISSMFYDFLYLNGRNVNYLSFIYYYYDYIHNSLY